VPQAWYFRRQPVPRVGARLLGMQPQVFYPSTLRPCKDGWVHAHTNVRHPDLMAVMMEEPRLADAEILATPMGHADEIDGLMHPWLSEHTKQEVVDSAQELRIPFTAVNTPIEVFNDRNLRARGYFVPVEHPSAGRVEQPGSPYHCSETPWELRPAPLLGQHNQQVFVDELGLSPEDLARLRDRGVI
jgi:crotonobetainyl-CoA:carnitine CoA-transferase CaiB-like acyl-CoA transferase